MLTQAMLAAAERSVALAVSRDPLTAKRLGALSGKVIRISARAPDFTVYLLPDSTGIGLLGPQANLEADCSLDAPAALLARLVVSRERKQVLEDPQCELSFFIEQFRCQRCYERRRRAWRREISRA